MNLLSVGVIGHGIVGKKKIQFILKNKNLERDFVSDIKFKKNFKKKNHLFQKI